MLGPKEWKDTKQEGPSTTSCREMPSRHLQNHSLPHCGPSVRGGALFQQKSNPDPTCHFLWILPNSFLTQMGGIDKRLMEQLGVVMHGVELGIEPWNPFPLPIINIFIACNPKRNHTGSPWSSSGMACSPTLTGCSAFLTWGWEPGVGRCQFRLLLADNLALSFQ